MWRAATAAELKNVIPARAAVEKERIETEDRTASGITNGSGKFVAGVVLITAGYSAEGKYSHYFETQVPLSIGTFTLAPGEYVFGSRHDGDGLAVTFYHASDGKQIGIIHAARLSRIGRIESFHISPPAEHTGTIAIGRFGFPFEISR